MSRSLIQNVKQCYVCSEARTLEKHHVFFGTANRSKAEEDGCWVWLCPTHHRSERGVHGAYGGKLKLAIQRKTQLEWQTAYGKDETDFIKRYGRNYLVAETVEENKDGGYPYS